MASLSPNTPKYFMSKRVHNIILLGESGAGKSTFINAIANYLIYVDFEIAEKNELKILVGTSVPYMDKNRKFQSLNAYEDENENNKKLGESKTQSPKSYKLHLGQEVWVRIIDTPGINDTRGREQDKENLEAIMKIIDACNEISAICVVMKPDPTRMNDTFVNCLNQLFGQLHQSIAKNLVFIFTHGKGVDYEPIMVQEMINQFFIERNINISLTLENTNCFENDPFNYLLAVKHQLSSRSYNVSISWQKSTEESRKLINYILNLEPHNVKNTVNINKTRHLIEKLTLELSRITEYIGNYLQQTDQSIKDVKSSKDIDELENIKRKPQYVCETVKLDKPKLVCTSKYCTRIDRSGNVYYPQVCCPECGILIHMKGHGQYVKFASKLYFGRKYCSLCNCLASSHKLMFFETKIVIKNISETVYTVISRSKESLRAELLKKLELERITNYNERNAIIRAMALFYYYMKCNSIIEYEDIFEAQNHAKLTDYAPNSTEFEETNELLQLYEKEKLLIETQGEDVTIVNLEVTRHQLCSLALNGEYIKNIYTDFDSSLGSIKIDNEICVEVPFFQF